MNVATAIAPLGQPGHAALATCEADTNSLSVADSLCWYHSGCPEGGLICQFLCQYIRC